MLIVNRIAALFERAGDSQYGGEAVSQRDHAVQAAWLAEQDGASPELITAALLHDIGHLLHDLPDDSPDQGIDDFHENSGYHFLKRWFADSVCEPVRLHVTAKRYLCSVDAGYEAQLSEPSRVSLRLQGGNLSAEELDAFHNNPHWQAAVRLRHWDDLAKVAGLATPELAHFLEFVAVVATKRDSEL